MERRLLVSAFGINAGGGLVLLTALLPALTGVLRAILLDERLAARRIELDASVIKKYVRRSFPDRLLSLHTMASAAAAHDVLLCFNSLPPLRKSRGRVVLYVQAPHFFGTHKGVRYPWPTRLRILIERCWFRLGLSNCDEIWVQTRTMADALRARYPAARIELMPLVDGELSRMLAARALPHVDTASLDRGAVTFFYPADAVAHKNHENLLRAWQMLARERRAPRLYLTLEPAELEEIVARLRLDRSALGNVIALGRIPREQVLERLTASSALIFPSLAETFGLPLLEAAALGVPIIAAERDFVREVCSPQQTFDPASPRSIATAAERFISGVQAPARYFSAAEFVARVLGPPLIH